MTSQLEVPTYIDDRNTALRSTLGALVVWGAAGVVALAVSRGLVPASPLGIHIEHVLPVNESGTGVLYNVITLGRTAVENLKGWVA